MKPNLSLMPLHVTGRWLKQNLRNTLLGLWLICAVMVSGCQSNLPTVPLSPSKVTIEASLMVEPNYTQRLLKLLSESPKTQTDK